MARYQVWNKTDNIITPIGEVMTPEKWIERYPMAEFIKIVIGGGTVNGSLCMVFDDMVETYREMGCDFQGCETDQDYLYNIELFEDQQRDFEKEMAANHVSAEERIAAALEAQVMLSLSDSTEE